MQIQLQDVIGYYKYSPRIISWYLSVLYFLGLKHLLHEFFIYKFCKIASHRLLTHGGALVGIFFDDPFLFQNLNLSQTSFVDGVMKQSVK